MECPERISCVLFDFDGVIVDTEPIGLELDREAYSKLGVEVSFEDAMCIIGTDAQGVVADLFKRHGRPDLTPEDFHAQRQSADVIYETLLEAPMPGAEEALSALRERGIAVGLVSTTIAKNLLVALDRLHLLHYFDAIVGGDMVAHKKPAPDPWLAALGHLGANRANAIAVDDSPTGIRSAKNAELFVCGFKGGSIEQDTSNANVEVANFAEFIAFIDERNARG